MEDVELCKLLKIKQTSLEQLRTYVHWAEQSGTYWRPKNQFDARHKEIMKALNMPIPYEF